MPSRRPSITTVLRRLTDKRLGTRRRSAAAGLSPSHFAVARFAFCCPILRLPRCLDCLASLRRGARAGCRDPLCVASWSSRPDEAGDPHNADGGGLYRIVPRLRCYGTAGTSSAMTWTKVSMSTGLVMCLAKPTSLARCLSRAYPWPVTAMAGIAQSEGCRRMVARRS